MRPIFSENPEVINLLSIAGIISGVHMFLIVGFLGFIFIIPPTIMFILSLIDFSNHKTQQ
ncbi:hypothetical protein CD149_06065 [Staphylococcus condimenti]|uniref:Uncharacterized protein n=1 Tax=Staphylococcus condimenti TaxID=70255 RepID=A0A143PBG5_9STAP|nr:MULTISPECIES: hypothetical protein [Staphylococcus]AMY05109.1 hypothetical protein A4G25_03850 [Staphylococcus condimenti]APR61302.1 hypothetical protein BTZ13_08800 [Staphylococcus condimenti]MDK8645780.1 hypothetical protein [Staphylococcus condimenti]OFP02372.1 hypothetical protein HMPREF3007_03775 [Staphylococcus sp. HMSC065E08]PNZ60986.1 hypothetical protein CD149_06065 [Staphylococcus condimenti]